LLKIDRAIVSRNLAWFHAILRENMITKNSRQKIRGFFQPANLRI